ncbi:RM22 protein, partial [Polypterus senegalus]
FFRLLPSCSFLHKSSIHTSHSLETKSWERKNRIVYPPQLPGDPPRQAEIYHCRRQIKYSKDKMWYLAKLIRGMTIDQAIAQLEFNNKKGAKIIKEVLLEAQDIAVRNHNVEYKSNLYIAESFSGKGQYLKRIRYHGRGMFGIMDKVYCHYFVKLVEVQSGSDYDRKTGVKELFKADPLVRTLNISGSTVLEADSPISCESPSLTEIAQMVNQLRVGKAAGICGIRGDLLQAGCKAVLLALQAIFASIWEMCVILNDWKMRLGVSIWKGKGDFLYCSSYRGITLLSVPDNVLARVILNRICDHLLTYQQQEQSDFTLKK